jgi:hypothetical protein
MYIPYIRYMEETWKPIVGFEGLYEISSFGRVKSLIKRGSYRELIKRTGRDISTGYHTVQLTKGNKPRDYRIHRLVALAHLENPNNYPVVNHLDGNKSNNRLDNLEWTTYSKNTLHSYSLGLQRINRGDNNYITKIKDGDVCVIRSLISQGKTNKEIAILFGVNPSQISTIKTGKRRSYIKCDDIC